jgi:diaminopimelate epimerase
MMNLLFSKYHGAGNDFVLVDDRSLFFPVSDLTLIRYLCHRHFGIGADGLILLQPSLKGDARMRIFNSDASEPEMCGNGLRCLALFCQRHGWTKKEIRIETKAGIFLCLFREKGVGVIHERLFESYSQHFLLTCNQEENVYFVNSGVPHAILFKDDFAELDVEKRGRKIRFSSLFHPHGANVNFVKPTFPGRLELRTYERGVEKETLACGTAIAAAAFAAHKALNMNYPIEVITLSKEKFIASSYSESAIEIIGPARWVFDGTFNKEENNDHWHP